MKDPHGSTLTRPEARLYTGRIRRSLNTEDNAVRQQISEIATRLEGHLSRTIEGWGDLDFSAEEKRITALVTALREAVSA